jgi:hypothetical protein
MRKFSGTDQAGSTDADDFAGITCDAFAHFTAMDLNLDFVIVDIQGIVSLESFSSSVKLAFKTGIVTSVYDEGVKCADTITLFDLLAHSKRQSMGLRDKGLEGIEEFCQQHQCNRICKKFGLRNLNKLFKEVTEIGLRCIVN